MCLFPGADRCRAADPEDTGLTRLEVAPEALQVGTHGAGPFTNSSGFRPQFGIGVRLFGGCGCPLQQGR